MVGKTTDKGEIDEAMTLADLRRNADAFRYPELPTEVLLDSCGPLVMLRDPSPE